MLFDADLLYLTLSNIDQTHQVYVGSWYLLPSVH